MKDGIGLGLSRRFFEQLVAPALKAHFPHIPYAAARIGLGSEVLGYDTEMSADHDYGPCVQVFLPADAFPAIAQDIMRVLDSALPEQFEGYAVRYPTAVRPPGAQIEMMQGSDHGAELYTVHSWCDRFLGRQFDVEPTSLEWLSYPEHLFLSATAGAVFRDDTGELTRLRQRLQYFPRDVWLYKLATQWGRVAEERAYVGRAGSVGDEIGSRVIAARMIGNLMHLAMLLERQYAPYAKWFGRGFLDLQCASLLEPLLRSILDAQHWQERETHLIDACRLLSEVQLKRGIPGATPAQEGSLHGRPFRFIDTMKIENAIRAQIEDRDLIALPDFGAVDQFLAGFVLAVPSWSQTAAAALFEAGAAWNTDGDPARQAEEISTK
jgi:hypothetical protein